MLRPPTLEQLDQSPGVRIFLCTQATDMRRSFDRLTEMVQQTLMQDPLTGNLFVFRSRSSDRLKILYWDQDGFCIWYKRLEAGTFRFPRVAEGQSNIEIKASELAMLLEGIDLRSLKRGPRFTVPSKKLSGQK